MHSRFKYCPKSTQNLPEEERPKYKVFESSNTLEGDVDGKNVQMKYRTLFVWSEAKAEQERKTRERHLGNTKAAFVKVEQNLNKYSLKTHEKIVSRLEAAKSKYSVGEVFQYKLSQRLGIFSMQWSIDKKELKRLAELDGAYILKKDFAVSVGFTC